jgi:pyruvate kinase
VAASATCALSWPKPARSHPAGRKGPEIRTIKLEGGNDVSLVAGQTFTFTTDQTVVGNKDKVAVTYAGFASDLRVGNRILVDDGPWTSSKSPSAK